MQKLLVSKKSFVTNSPTNLNEKNKCEKYFWICETVLLTILKHLPAPISRIPTDVATNYFSRFLFLIHYLLRTIWGGVSSKAVLQHVEANLMKIIYRMRQLVKEFSYFVIPCLYFVKNIYIMCITFHFHKFFLCLSSSFDICHMSACTETFFYTFERKNISRSFYFCTQLFRTKKSNDQNLHIILKIILINS